MKINKEWLEMNLVDLLNKKEEELNKLTSNKDKIEEDNNFSISILINEIDDINYIIKNKYSAEAIQTITGETTSISLLEILTNIEEAEDEEEIEE